jgi:hypothetical protein
MRTALLWLIIGLVATGCWWQVRERLARERGRPRREVLADVAISVAGAVLVCYALIIGLVRPL